MEPIELRAGDDLEQLVRDAVSRGADALAMEGGDGSQAVVAMVAAELDLLYACIAVRPSGGFASRLCDPGGRAHPSSSVASRPSLDGHRRWRWWWCVTLTRRPRLLVPLPASDGDDRADDARR